MNQMPLHQAVALGLCLVDFELEQPQVSPPPPDWRKELTAAQETLRAFLADINPPPQPPPQLTPQQAQAETQRSRKHNGPRYGLVEKPSKVPGPKL